MITKFYFDYREFCIEDSDCGSVVLDKLYRNFILPLSAIREKYGRKIHVSKKSGYRSVRYELSRDRSGDSEHTFVHGGAVDLIWSPILQDLIMESKCFGRVIVYPDRGFMHLDLVWVSEGRPCLYHTYDNGRTLKLIRCG